MSCSTSKSGVKKSVNDSPSEIPVVAEPSPVIMMSVLEAAPYPTSLM